ncbi:hypothetical protein H0H81_002425 [Sphagnurus paluster]|uniref:Uncharacterized protein n=1 Tax=Sphagnurus paluster TaxID=117069 RepID=A0A9P7K2W8_9AGAR|nr:hypothetical protein H0H81_002425 [Sphagnurus paluster]
MSDTLDDLFPAPSGRLSRTAPNTLPGITPQSTEALRQILKDSHRRWHVFFDPDYRPHNHAPHAAIALWALGADHDVLQEAYVHDCKLLEARYDSPGSITVDNVYDHLGDADAYLDFFDEVIRTDGVSTALDKYLFNIGANFLPGRNADQQPQMLDRLFDGIIHPIIHLGYGLEFGLPGLIAEGDPEFFHAIHAWEGNVALQSASLTNGKVPNPTTNTHALSILARILKDPRFDDVPGGAQYYDIYRNTISKFGSAIREYVDAWSYDRTNPTEAERKVEELIWANTLIYGVSGWKKDEHFNTDFFFAHMVTSSLFLSSFVAHIPPASQEILLRAYFGVSLVWWIGRDRPGFDISGFFAHASPNTVKDTKKSAMASPNPWLALIGEALVAPDEHIPKVLRSLLHYANAYGRRPAGHFAGTELEGAEFLDGTLFVRTAHLTHEKLRRDGDATDFAVARYWNRQGTKVQPGADHVIQSLGKHIAANISAKL